MLIYKQSLLDSLQPPCKLTYNPTLFGSVATGDESDICFEHERNRSSSTELTGGRGLSCSSCILLVTAKQITPALEKFGEPDWAAVCQSLQMTSF